MDERRAVRLEVPRGDAGRDQSPAVFSNAQPAEMTVLPCIYHADFFVLHGSLKVSPFSSYFQVFMARR
jgi:hypothetical protein